MAGLTLMETLETLNKMPYQEAIEILSLEDTETLVNELVDYIDENLETISQSMQDGGVI